MTLVELSQRSRLCSNPEMAPHLPQSQNQNPFNTTRPFYDLAPCDSSVPPSGYSPPPAAPPFPPYGLSHQTTTEAPLKAFVQPVLLAWKALILNIYLANFPTSFKPLFQDHFLCPLYLKFNNSPFLHHKNRKENPSHLAKTRRNY